MLSICCRVKPDWALLVPESREEVTTEGGLDVAGDPGRVAEAIARLKDAGILTSLFIDPDLGSNRSISKVGVDAVELHTGPYALAKHDQQTAELAG